MTASIVEVIQHYQRSIDNSQDNEARLLYCIQKLYKLPIKVEHLQETGVGKTVNSLRKFNGEIGVAAKSLVTKWKAMVAAEEEPMDTTPHSYDDNNDTHNNDNGNADEQSPQNNNNDEEEDENLNHHNSSTTQQSQNSKHSGHSEKDKHKERSHSSSHKESSSKHSTSSSKNSNDKHKSSSSSSSSRDKEGHQKSNGSSSSSSSKEREKEKTEHKSRDKHKDKDQDKEHRERSEKRKDDKHQKSEKETKSESSSSHKSSSKHKSDEDKHNHRSSSKDKTDKEKERSDKHHHKSSSKDKEKSKEEKSSSSSSKDKSERKSSSSHKTTSSSSTKDSSETSEGKKRHNSDTESSDFKSPQPKVAKLHKSSTSSSKALESVSPPPQDDDNDDCFDSSMGTNFGDILGMLNVPTKKSKKLNKSPAASGSCSSKDSPPKPSTSNRKNGVSTSPAIYSPMPTIKIPTAKPDLLASTAKLEPLDPSIALELPTISTNYRPMPLNQTVMDCVFNTCTSSSKPSRILSDAEALQHSISSKNMRTKIYSGTKSGQIFQVPSLFDMCIRILQKNIDALEYTGGVPFEVLRPVLERATPQQLFIFEDYNPYLMEDSDVLWQFHVSRNYRTQKRLENESWREMYMRCQEDEERKLSFLKDSIKQSQKIAAAPVRKTQLAFIDSMVKPPRNVMRKQEQYGTKSKLVATPAARVVSLQNSTPNAAKTGDQRLKVAATVRDHAQVSNSSSRNKKAPLMQKTLAFMRGRLKR